MDGITQRPNQGYPNYPQSNHQPNQPQPGDQDNFFRNTNIDPQQQFSQPPRIDSSPQPRVHSSPLSPPPAADSIPFAPPAVNPHSPNPSFNTSSEPLGTPSDYNEPPRPIDPPISHAPFETPEQLTSDVFRHPVLDTHNQVATTFEPGPTLRESDFPPAVNSAPAMEIPTEHIVQSAFEPVPSSPVTPRVEDEKVSYQDAQIQEIEIAKIVANPYQPRKVFKPEALQELADSIREHGVVQPIVVTEAGSGYEIVVGERRFRASQLAGLTRIPAIVKKTLHDQTKLEVALIENIQRQELNAIEEAQAYERLIKAFNMTQEQVAKKVGKSRPAITNTLRLLNLPAEIQRGVIEGKISEGHARAILGLPDIEKQLLMYQTILDQGLNVRQVESKVREIAVKRRMDAATPDPKLMAIESELRGKLGAQVKVQRQGRGGKITIEFFSDEDLEEILNRIAEDKRSDNNYFTV